MAEYKKYRKHNKIYELPDEVKRTVDDMLLDTSITYSQISEYLKGMEYDISRSTIGRYALETHKLANKLIETREQVRELVRLAKDESGENLAEGAIQIATNKLTEKIAMAEEEIDDMDITDAIKLTSTIARTKAYKDKVYSELKSDYEKATEQFKKLVYKELEQYPEIIEKLAEIADKTLGAISNN